MIELADIVNGYGDDYLRQFGASMLPSHKRALADIVACRTEIMGGHAFECSSCGHQRYSYHSCKNRSCPKCHTTDTNKWLEKRQREILPVSYFHLVFTLPQELRHTVRSHQEELLSLLITTAAETVMTLGRDPKYIGGRLAILAVLHTWSRTLEYHPHVHMLIPAGGLSKEGVWIPARKRFLVPVRALSKGFRARFLKRAKKALPSETFPQSLWEKDWVVYCKPALRKEKEVLIYLGRYVHRIAIANSRIESLNNGRVTFRYQESGTGRWKRMNLTAMEFLRRYLQHVLPQGFHKVRTFGLQSPAYRLALKRLQLLLAKPVKRQAEQKPQPPLNRVYSCPYCEAAMVIVSWLPRRARSPPQEAKGQSPAI